MTAVPAERIVTWTVVVVLPALKVAVAGTVATLVLLDDRFTVSPPAGAAPDSVRVKSCVPPPETLTVEGVNEIDPVT